MITIKNPNRNLDFLSTHEVIELFKKYRFPFFEWNKSFLLSLLEAYSSGYLNEDGTQRLREEIILILNLEMPRDSCILLEKFEPKIVLKVTRKSSGIITWHQVIRFKRGFYNENGCYYIVKRGEEFYFSDEKAPTHALDLELFIFNTGEEDTVIEEAKRFDNLEVYDFVTDSRSFVFGKNQASLNESLVLDFMMDSSVYSPGQLVLEDNYPESNQDGKVEIVKTQTRYPNLSEDFRIETVQECDDLIAYQVQTETQEISRKPE